MIEFMNILMQKLYHNSFQFINFLWYELFFECSYSRKTFIVPIWLNSDIYTIDVRKMNIFIIEWKKKKNILNNEIEWNLFRKSSIRKQNLHTKWKCFFSSIYGLYIIYEPWQTHTNSRLQTDLCSLAFKHCLICLR